jgi:hypothetical protein
VPHISSIVHLSSPYPSICSDHDGEDTAEMEEPSTQTRTKARHDPAALRAVQEELGQQSSQHSTRPRRGDPPPFYAEGSEEEIEEERTKSDDDEVEDDTYEQPPEPPRRHGKGPAKEKTHYKPHPKKSHHAPYIHKDGPLLVLLLNTNKE